MHVDKVGLIVQSNGDGGDTLQRMGFWYEGKFFNPTYDSNGALNVAPYSFALSDLCVNGKYIRYPGQWDNPADTSRDQLVSNIRAMGYYEFKPDLKNILGQIFKNWSRYPNGDIAFLQDYARFARAFKAWWLYPVMLLGDIFLFGNTLVRIWKGMNYDDVGDDINHIGDLAQARNYCGTPISWLARLFYVAFRHGFSKQVDGKFYSDDKMNGGLWALQWYFRADSGGNPEFADLWGPTVCKF
jgi:hypothetical protein